MKGFRRENTRNSKSKLEIETFTIILVMVQFLCIKFLIWDSWAPLLRMDSWQNLFNKISVGGYPQYMIIIIIYIYGYLIENYENIWLFQSFDLEKKPKIGVSGYFHWVRVFFWEVRVRKGYSKFDTFSYTVPKQDFC